MSSRPLKVCKALKFQHLGDSVDEIVMLCAVNGTLEYRPSVVAAAATLAAVDRTLTRADIEERIQRSRVSDFGFTATVVSPCKYMC